MFRLVACAVSVLKEIRPCVIESDGVLRHAVTRQPITEEWLFEYLPKAIEFPTCRRMIKKTARCLIGSRT